MGFSFNINWGMGKQPLSVERDSSGNWFYTMFSSRASHTEVFTDSQKLDVILRNPAALKCLALNADLGSLGQINQYKDGKIQEENFLYSITQQPNFKQSWTQFIWDYYFWVQLGTAYLWNPGNAKVLKKSNPIQWLIPANMNWESTVINKLKGLIFSEITYKDLLKQTIKYDLGNGHYKMIPLSDITPFFDLSNGLTDNFYKGASRIDALYKVISNSEMALDAKSTTLDFVQKYMVSGQQDPDNITQLPMSEPEKKSIKEKITGYEKVHVVKSMIEIKRFVDDLNKLKLDDSFYSDAFMIGSMLNIPRDTLEFNLKGSTYENQEKSTGRHVEYSLKPKSKMLTDWFEKQYDYQDIRMSWDHLSFNQVFEKDRAEKTQIQLENIKLAKELGLSEADAKKLIDNLLLS